MLTVTCRGTPYEIGFTHGTTCSVEIERCIIFYSDLFSKKCHQTWDEVLANASLFEQNILARWPRYHEEMKGIADGSNRSLLEIVALNVRTEIAFGQYSDGCTSLSWKTAKGVFLGQNWDWETQQKENLVLMTIESEGFPSIKMITEAGIIGKIGFNSAGVGVCLNAIRARGCVETRLPVHLGLRAVLESTSAGDALQLLHKYGMASSAHFLIADSTETFGLEFTSSTFATLHVDPDRICHTNHFLLEGICLNVLAAHSEGYDPDWLPDSDVRLSRMKALAAEGLDPQAPDLSDFAELFKDEEGFPSGICREEKGVSDCATLFSISMDLEQKKGNLRVGKAM